MYLSANGVYGDLKESLTDMRRKAMLYELLIPERFSSYI